MVTPATGTYDLLFREDGRPLAFSEFGRPDGFPVFYFHGTPSCRVEAGFADQAAQHAGFRLIATDRPGFGRSGFQKNRRFRDWPGDILALADHLGINQFGLAGHSGAGPHLFACGVFMNPDRLKFIGALGPWGPVASPEIMSSLNRLDKVFARLAQKLPWVMRIGFAPMGWAARFTPNLFLGLLKNSVSAADKEILDNKEVAQRFREMQREAFRQGSRGAAHEAFIAYSDWGFDISSVCVPVHIWLGDEDIFVTRKMGQHIADTIPGVKFHWVEGAGHLNFADWKSIFASCRQHIA
ncbi:alpha/beta fold hydrolase [Jannaschia sp. CCS1]|uniref:alpha/beta fold hydrolase n=1 Tax=Jannaschia sp. (strain CCS1) TaxID=290400 RepID=UPI000053D4B0|nr:alpha/beta hydrolase [Jannaschia sp. CCS1]ABD56457.1 alpha/beta hydrolase [Jannaschia sp. CCS1]